MTDTDAIRVISLDGNEWTECHRCGKETPHRWGLPVNMNGEITPNWSKEEWGGVPACEDCYRLHAKLSDETKPTKD